MNDLTFLAAILRAWVVIVQIDRRAKNALPSYAGVTCCAVIRAVVTKGAVLKGLMNTAGVFGLTYAEILRAGLVVIAHEGLTSTDQLTRCTGLTFAKHTQVIVCATIRVVTLRSKQGADRRRRLSVFFRDNVAFFRLLLDFNLKFDADIVAHVLDPVMLLRTDLRVGHSLLAFDVCGARKRIKGCAFKTDILRGKLA